MEKLYLFCLMFSLYVIVKAFNFMNHHTKILIAIDRYVDYTHDYSLGLIMLDKMAHLATMLLKFWDWGYKGILPKEYFKLIEPYIK